MNLPVNLRKVTIKNYKSIASCDVDLEPLTFLVGPNGSGKSNFLDALRFCADALRHSLDQAVRDRGGINEVRRRSAGSRPNHLAIRLKLEIAPSYVFHYYFEIGARSNGGYVVEREECIWRHAEDDRKSGEFSVKNGLACSTIKNTPPAGPDRLFLVNMAGFNGPDLLYRALSSMGFYSLNPERIRDLQSPDSGELLARDGGNLAAVLASLMRNDPERGARVLEFLRLVVPGITEVQSKALGPKETLEFTERSSPGEKSRRFLASSVSDGTLRALAVIVALFQRSSSGGNTIPVVGIEEPEMALHPAAASVLFDCLHEASLYRQVLVTSHSPDLLDRPDIPVESILAVSAEDGKTFVGPVDKVTRKMLKARLRTAGELLRINQISPDWTAIPNTSELQMRLFK